MRRRSSGYSARMMRSVTASSCSAVHTYCCTVVARERSCTGASHTLAEGFIYCLTDDRAHKVHSVSASCTHTGGIRPRSALAARNQRHIASERPAFGHEEVRSTASGTRPTSKVAADLSFRVTVFPRRSSRAMSSAKWVQISRSCGAHFARSSVSWWTQCR